MFFTKKKRITSTGTDPVTPGVNAEAVTEQAATAAIALPEDPNGSTNLLGRLFHKESYSGPETSYENEAWAPETTGLFRKRRFSLGDPNS